ncbi:hypothetical protein [Photobacterium nomapromontoriensis]|uniref:hypothetical protein n=1 Tax=Photobacterium nomapromontoriensis TaxID=2910237 RepID=UPI003D0F8F1E
MDSGWEFTNGFFGVAFIVGACEVLRKRDGLRGVLYLTNEAGRMVYLSVRRFRGQSDEDYFRIHVVGRADPRQK